MIRLREKHLSPFLDERDLEKMESRLQNAFENLTQKKGPGNDYLGWVNLPLEFDRDEFDRIELLAEKIRSTCDVLVVIGIGGSYLGARAVIDALTPAFRLRDADYPEIIFAGHQLSGNYLHDLLAYLEDKRVAVNVISKSGTTTEPAIAFRIFRDYMEERYGDTAVERIYVTTDRERGALKQLADEVGYETFVVPDDIGGRYSVLTAVGLLPIAAAGIDIKQLLLGAQTARKQALENPWQENPAMRYAAIRNVLLEKGFAVEILVNYDPALMFFTEWWKQLYGESEGKDGKGLFPAGVNFTSDLHSMGQYIQDGRRIVFETVLDFVSAGREVLIPNDPDNLDGLNFLSGKPLQQVNRTAMQGTMIAHEDGGTPTLRLTCDDLNAQSIGELIYFFEFACGISGHLLGVNPFNQPGVEAYKVNMFALLGKPGFEAEREALADRLDEV